MNSNRPRGNPYPERAASDPESPGSRRAWAWERRLLGCALHDPRVLAAPVEPGDFARPPHGNLWRRLRELRLVTGHAHPAWMELALDRAEDWQQEVDGVAYVSLLPHAVGSVLAWPTYAAEVVAAAELRRARLAAIALAAAIERGEATADTVAAASAALADCARRLAAARLAPRP